MFKSFLQNFKTTNECIILALPLILSMLATQLYLYSIGNYTYSAGEYMFIFVTLIVWFSGIFASWFYMVKKTLEYNDSVFPLEENRKKAFLGLFKALFKGIGKFFLPMLTVVILFLILNSIKWIIEALIIIYATPDYAWILATDILFCYVILYGLMFWIPEIIYNERNPFKALLKSIKNTFKSFNDFFILYTVLFLISVFIVFLLLVSIGNLFLYFLTVLILYYFMVYSVVIVFNYYRKNFIQSEE